MFIPITPSTSSTSSRRTFRILGKDQCGGACKSLFSHMCSGNILFLFFFRFLISRKINMYSSHVLYDFVFAPFFFSRFFELLGDGIFSADGDNWYHQRKVKDNVWKNVHACAHVSLNTASIIFISNFPRLVYRWQSTFSRSQISGLCLWIS